jgi:hypothetical protein
MSAANNGDRLPCDVFVLFLLFVFRFLCIRGERHPSSNSLSDEAELPVVPFTVCVDVEELDELLVVVESDEEYDTQIRFSGIIQIDKKRRKSKREQTHLRPVDQK